MSIPHLILGIVVGVLVSYARSKGNKRLGWHILLGWVIASIIWDIYGYE